MVRHAPFCPVCFSYEVCDRCRKAEQVPALNVVFVAPATIAMSQCGDPTNFYPVHDVDEALYAVERMLGIHVPARPGWEAWFDAAAAGEW